MKTGVTNTTIKERTNRMVQLLQARTIMQQLSEDGFNFTCRYSPINYSYSDKIVIIVESKYVDDNVLFSIEIHEDKVLIIFSPDMFAFDVRFDYDFVTRSIQYEIDKSDFSGNTLIRLIFSTPDEASVFFDILDKKTSEVIGEIV